MDAESPTPAQRRLTIAQASLRYICIPESVPERGGRLEQGVLRGSSPAAPTGPGHGGATD